MTSDAAFARELAETAGRILLERYERVEVIDHLPVSWPYGAVTLPDGFVMQRTAGTDRPR